MSKDKVETVDDIIAEMRRCVESAGTKRRVNIPTMTVRTWLGLAARLEAAYGRDVAKLDNVFHARHLNQMLRTSQAALEVELAKVAELRECLELAVEMKCTNCGMCRSVTNEPCHPEGSIIHHEDCMMIQKWKRAMETTK